MFIQISQTSRSCRGRCVCRPARIPQKIQLVDWTDHSWCWSQENLPIDMQNKMLWQVLNSEGILYEVKFVIPKQILRRIFRGSEVRILQQESNYLKRREWQERWESLALWRRKQNPRARSHTSTRQRKPGGVRWPSCAYESMCCFWTPSLSVDNQERAHESEASLDRIRSRYFASPSVVLGFFDKLVPCSCGFPLRY